MSWNIGFSGLHPTTETDAKKLAETAGLRLGGDGFRFANRYRTKGLYSYNTGRFQGIAFFGQGGSDQDMRKELDSPKYRPTLIVADPDEVGDPDDEVGDPDDDPVDRVVGHGPGKHQGVALVDGATLSVGGDANGADQGMRMEVELKTSGKKKEMVDIRDNMTLGELQSKMMKMTGLKPGNLELILDENDPKTRPWSRKPFLTPIGEAMDRRSAIKGSSANTYTTTGHTGFAQTYTKEKGGSSSTSAGIAGSVGMGSWIPVVLEASVSTSRTDDKNWSLSSGTTVHRGTTIEEEFTFPAGEKTQYYTWAIMLPDGDNIDRVFHIPSDSKYVTFTDDLKEGLTIEQYNAQQTTRADFKFGFPEPTPDAPKVIAPKKKEKVWFTLKNGHGMYLSCPSNKINTSKGLYIDQRFPDQNGQLWCEEPIEGHGDNAGVRIKSKLTYRGKSYYVAVYEGKRHNGANIGVYKHAGSSSQGFSISPNADSSNGGYITHDRSDRVLSTYKNRSSRSGSILWSRRSTDGQRWQREFVE